MFGAAGVVTWFTGSRLAQYVDGLTDNIAVGGAFSGMLLLRAITSLPEMSAVSTGAFYGDAALATNNLLGSLAVNVAMIAVADAVVRQSALTALVGGLSTLLQAILSIMALTLTVTAMTVGDRLVAGIGVWTAVMRVRYSCGRSNGFVSRIIGPAAGSLWICHDSPSSHW